jgi:hypothetical protein
MEMDCTAFAPPPSLSLSVCLSVMCRNCAHCERCEWNMEGRMDLCIWGHRPCPSRAQPYERRDLYIFTGKWRVTKHLFYVILLRGMACRYCGSVQWIPLSFTRVLRLQSVWTLIVLRSILTRKYKTVIMIFRPEMQNNSLPHCAVTVEIDLLDYINWIHDLKALSVLTLVSVFIFETTNFHGNSYCTPAQNMQYIGCLFAYLQNMDLNFALHGVTVNYILLIKNGSQYQCS